MSEWGFAEAERKANERLKQRIAELEADNELLWAALEASYEPGCDCECCEIVREALKGDDDE